MTGVVSLRPRYQELVMIFFFVGPTVETAFLN
jgi:hypothetical protein